MVQVINKILFRAFRPWLTKNSPSFPLPAQAVMPEWYKNSDRFAKNPIDGEYYKAPKEVCPFPKEGTIDDYGMIPTWKACPAIMDSFMTGYVLRTPCDITFFKNDSGRIDVKVHDKRHEDFIQKRQEMPQFQHPIGYYKDHFAWYADWSFSLPEGYSSIFMTPMNRYDLPFMNTTGVVDNDKVTMMGTVPFFIIDGWEGTIPAGTPCMQFLPFKREDWQHEVTFLSGHKIYEEYMENAKFYRQPDGGVYKNKIWERREYK